MARSFDVGALIQVAVLDERSGANMYRVLAGKAHNGGLKEAFLDLVAQENKHGDQFEQLQKQLESATPVQSVQYPDEYVDYLDVLIARGGSSAEIEEELVSNDDPALIDLAMRFEKEQLNLQRDMGTLLGETHRAVIDQIIREEMAHLVTLDDLKKKIRG